MNLMSLTAILALMACVARTASGQNNSGPSVTPGYFMSHSERLDDVIATYLPSVVAVKVRPARQRAVERQRAILEKLNPQIKPFPSLTERFQRNLLVILPDPRQPEATFGWFTCNGLESFLRQAQRELSRSPALFGALNELRHNDNGFRHLYFVTNSPTDIDVWVGRNSTVARQNPWSAKTLERADKLTLSFLLRQFDAVLR